MALTQVKAEGIATGAVTTPKLEDDAVSNAKLTSSGTPANRAVGADTVQDDAIGVAALSATGTASNTTFLRGDNSWQAISSSDSTKMPLAGGTFTGDVIFDNAANAGRDLSWNDGEDKLKFEDDTKAVFGTGNDLQIYHDGTNSNITNGASSGHLYIHNDDTSKGIALLAQNYWFNNEANTENMITAAADGAVNLYYDGSKKFETTTNGVNIPANNLTIDANNGEKISLKGTSQPYIRWYEDTTAKAYIQWANAGYLQIQNEETSKGLRIGGSGIEVLDSVEFVCGTDQDLKIYTDNSNSYVLHDGAGDLWVIANGSGEDLILQADTDIRIATNGTERFRLTGDGRILQGHTASITTWGAGLNHQTHGTNTDSSSQALTRWSDNASGPSIHFAKSRGGIGTQTIVQDNDNIGGLAFLASDGTDFNNDVARIDCNIDGTPGSNVVPGEIVFTTTKSTGQAYNNMKIRNDGNVEVLNGNVVIGTSGKGIDFSATSDTSVTGASTTSELFDDYEEGTWTPTNGNQTWASSPAFNATYTKVGRMVTVTAIQTSGTINWAQAQNMAGLPFAPVHTGAAGSWTNNYPNSGGEVLAWSTSIYFSQTDGYSDVYKVVFSITYEV